jgi:hypothetical protein
VKKQILGVFDRLTRRAIRQLPFQKARGDSFDIVEVAFLKAAAESAELYESHLIRAPSFPTYLSLLDEAAQTAKVGGLFMEFGVATGTTIRRIAAKTSEQVYGFDSFEGLPENWRSGFGKGAFAGEAPQVPQNVTLIKGWFEDTLPPFLASHPAPVSLLHIDCDLYSSTSFIFKCLGDRIKTGTVIVFDEYWNYPGWREHEYKAFEELKESGRFRAEPIGFVSSHQQVAFLIEESARR